MEEKCTETPSVSASGGRGNSRPTSQTPTDLGTWVLAQVLLVGFCVAKAPQTPTDLGTWVLAQVLLVGFCVAKAAKAPEPKSSWTLADTYFIAYTPCIEFFILFMCGSVRAARFLRTRAKENRTVLQESDQEEASKPGGFQTAQIGDFNDNKT